MKEYVNNFLLMLQFLTRIPININLKCEKDNFKKGAIFLPVIGLIIGIIQLCTYYIGISFFSPSITAILVFLTAMLLTGALHIDGLGDTCDGFYSFNNKEKIIEIMKDSRVGTFASIAIICDVLMKIELYKIAITNNAVSIIIIANIISRFSIVFLSYIGKRAKSTGSGNLFIGNMSNNIMIVSLIISLLLSITLLGIINSLIIIITSIIISIIISKYSEKKIGGLTGDLLGANNEIIEISVLLILIYLKLDFI